jgi:hypothetical protein
LTFWQVCVYERTVYGIQTRIRIKQCFNCTVLPPFTQTRSVSQDQRFETRTSYTRPAPPPPCGPPPSSQCTFNGPVSGTTNFVPPAPPCP